MPAEQIERDGIASLVPSRGPRQRSGELSVMAVHHIDRYEEAVAALTRIIYRLAVCGSAQKDIKPQFASGIVSSISFVSTTNTARSLAGLVLLALALTAWRSPGNSEKLWPAL